MTVGWRYDGGVWGWGCEGVRGESGVDCGGCEV